MKTNIILKQILKCQAGNKVPENDLDEGGYPATLDSRAKRMANFKRWDPAGGFGGWQLFYLTGNKGFDSEEDDFYRAYLGLPNDLPKMNPNAKTNWDDKIEAEKIKNGEIPSDFYGTTPRMDLNIQAIADTLNLGKIYRNYPEYKKRFPELPRKHQIKHMYHTGKDLLEHPNEWRQMNQDDGSLGIGRKLVTNNSEENPLGMLNNFGAKWIPEENKIYVHDTYDFPEWVRSIGNLVNRPKEMKIRGAISFDPKKGSKLLKDDLKEFNPESYPESNVNKDTPYYLRQGFDKVKAYNDWGYNDKNFEESWNTLQRLNYEEDEQK